MMPRTRWRHGDRRSRWNHARGAIHNRSKTRWLSRKWKNFLRESR